LPGCKGPPKRIYNPAAGPDASNVLTMKRRKREKVTFFLTFFLIFLNDGKKRRDFVKKRYFGVQNFELMYTIIYYKGWRDEAPLHPLRDHNFF
jgi:hypothetical protein